MVNWEIQDNLLNTHRFKTPTDLNIIELRSSEQKKHIGDHWMFHCLGNLLNCSLSKEAQFNLLVNFCWMPGFVGLHAKWSQAYSRI